MGGSVSTEIKVRSQARIHNGTVGRAGFNEGEWELFAADQEYLKHLHGGSLTQFWGENYEVGPWIIAMRWEPGAKADAHTHDHDTVYAVMSGTMTFNDGTGWYKQGDVRWVRAGTFYGPEEAGPEGCDLLLVTMGPMKTEFEGGDVMAASEVAG
jgi:mannose-6-phosphate isomerase-like protein (cupin superfamily)